MDWNWFYSAVAQSSAAIIGIFSAFIINKIINNQIQYNKNNDKIDRLINKSKHLKEKTGNRSFKSYNEKIRKEELDKIKKEIEKIEKVEEIKSKQHYYNEYDFSIYDNKEKIFNEIMNLLLDKTEKLYEKEKGSSSSKNGINMGGALKEAKKLENSVINKPKTNFLNTQKSILTNNEIKKIDDLFTEVKYHTRKITNFHNSIKNNPQHSSLIKLSLISIYIIFVVGVLFPLALLPYDGRISFQLSSKYILNYFTTTKGIILFLIFIIFTILLAKFFIINTNLKYNKEKIDELKHFTKLKNYSKYFQNRIENENNIDKEVN